MCDIRKCAITTEITATATTTATPGSTATTKMNNYPITYRLLRALFVEKHLKIGNHV